MVERRFVLDPELIHEHRHQSFLHVKIRADYSQQVQDERMRYTDYVLDVAEGNWLLFRGLGLYRHSEKRTIKGPELKTTRRLVDFG